MSDAVAAPAADAGPVESADTQVMSTEQAIEKAMSEPAKDERPNGKPSPVEDAPEDKPKAEPKPKDEKPAAKPVEDKPEPKPDAPKTDEKAEDKSEAPKDDKPKAKIPAPERLNDGAKAAWDEAPEAVRHEVVRMQRELEKGIEDYKAKVEPIRPYMEMAAKHGTTLDAALKAYVEAEQALHEDSVAALAKMAEQYVPGGLKAFVARLTGQPQGDADPRDAQIAQLSQQLAQLSQGFQQNTEAQQAAQQQSQLRTVIQEISGQMPRFEELKPEMQRLIETGYVTGDDPRDVYQRAYAYAERLIPATVEQEAAPPAPAPQTRPEATSIQGTAPSGSSPRDAAPLSTDEAILKAMKRFRSA